MRKIPLPQQAETLTRAAHGITKVALTTRDEFLAIVSHDLRNPLGAISMASQFISTNSAFLNAGKEARTLIDLIRPKTSADFLKIKS